MDGFPALVPSRRRFSYRTALFSGIALWILCVGIGCGDFTLFGDDDQGICDPDPCANTDNAAADTCEDLGGDDFTCDCEDGFEWDGASNACEELPFQLSSSAFSDGGQIPLQYAHADCDGDNVSPPLAWDNIPGDTQSFALFVVDSDSDPVFVHWAVFNIPASLSGIGEGLVPQGATQLQNDFGVIGYGGPCPPQNEEHEYTFTMMALSVDVIDATSYEEALADAEDAAVATASLVGRYSNIPDPCEDMEECFLTCNGFADPSCPLNCYSTHTGCDCILDQIQLVTECGPQCLLCFVSQNKACWDCVVPCGFDNMCQ